MLVWCISASMRDLAIKAMCCHSSRRQALGPLFDTFVCMESSNDHSTRDTFRSCGHMDLEPLKGLVDCFIHANMLS